MATTIDLTNYNALVNDDGSNTVGTLWQKTSVSSVILTPVQTAVTALDASIAATLDVGTCQGRLTLTAAVPVTTADVTAATTLRFALYKGNQIALYSGTAWALFTFPELSIAVPATTSQMYDVFVYDNAGTRTLELLTWTNDTTRATALVLQDGVLCKTGALTRRYVGSFRTTTVSGQTEDSVAKRYVWNMYNRVARPMQALDTTATWTYTIATFRQARATATNQLDFVMGLAEDVVLAEVVAAAANTNTGVLVQVAIGLDSTTTPHANSLGGLTSSQVANLYTALRATAAIYPTVGRHTLVWLELSVATGTTTFNSAGFGSTVLTAIRGTVMG